MSNHYSFQPFVTERNYLTDFENPFNKQLFRHYAQNEHKAFMNDIAEFSDKITTRWKPLIDKMAQEKSRPVLIHYDAFNNRVDDIRRPMEMHQLEQAIFSEALFSDTTSDWERTIKRFLLHHNGESGVMCPLACTDGLIAILEQYEHNLQPELKSVLKHLKEGQEGDYAIGAQYMSEIQGGSNLRANQLLAVEEDGIYKLYGNKFFCSATHADYSVVTARVKDTNHIALFVVPTWRNAAKTIRNDYRINRLKDKLGTVELPTAEIDYDGAIAYQLGEADKGISLAVGTVLTRSRIDIGFSSAAFMTRAAREATMYAYFRDVFDRKIAAFPLAFAQLEELEGAAKRSTAAAFEIYNRFLNIDRMDDSPEKTKEQYLVRVLILLQKVFSSGEAVDVLRKAMSIFGGHGVMEDFTSLPRLLRDAMVNELWEGPKNVLLTQVFNDLYKMQSWYPLDAFVADLLPQTDSNTATYVSELEELLQTPINGDITEQHINHARRWETLCQCLFHDYQTQVKQQFNDRALIEGYELNRTSTVQ